MANEISVVYDGAATPYVLIRKKDGTVWNGTAFETWSDGSITTYALDLGDLSGGYYALDMPAAVGAGLYSLIIRTRSGAATVSDATIVEDEINWSGAGETPPTPTTDIAGLSKLEAVNEILEGLGEYPVNALDTGGSSDAAQAERILDRVNLKIQSMGWHQNTENNVTLALDTNSRVPLASDVLAIDADPDYGGNNKYVRRGTYLWDVTNKTFTFTTQPIVERVKLLNFEDLLPNMKQYITVLAKIRAQRALQGSISQDRMLKEELLEARLEAKREDAEVGDYNIFNNLPAMYVAGNRRWGNGLYL